MTDNLPRNRIVVSLLLKTLYLVHIETLLSSTTLAAIDGDAAVSLRLNVGDDRQSPPDMARNVHKIATNTEFIFFPPRLFVIYTTRKWFSCYMLDKKLYIMRDFNLCIYIYIFMQTVCVINLNIYMCRQNLMLYILTKK